MMNPKSSYTLLSIFFTMILLQSCNFHFRGENVFEDLNDWQNVYVNYVTESPAEVKHLENTLNRVGVGLIDDARLATLVLDLKSDWTEQIVSVSTGTQIRQYRLTYSLQYALTRSADNALLSAETITLSRTFTQNENQMLGADNEKKRIQREMMLEAIYQLLLRLAKVKV